MRTFCWTWFLIIAVFTSEWPTTLGDDFRKWTSDQGTEAVLRFKYMEHGQITFAREDGTELAVPLDRLDFRSQQHAITQADIYTYDKENYALSGLFRGIPIIDRLNQAVGHRTQRPDEVLGTAQNGKPQPWLDAFRTSLLTSKEMRRLPRKRERAFLMAERRRRAVVLFFPLLWDIVNEERFGRPHLNEPTATYWHRDSWLEAARNLHPQWSIESSSRVHSLLEPASKGDIASCIAISEQMEAIDPLASIYWTLQAAIREDPASMFDVGKRYLFGDGVSKSEKVGAHFVLQSANRGNVEGQACASDCLRFGWGTVKNPELAFKFGKQAAEAGSVHGMKSLADMYASGTGIPTDKSEAANWYLKASQLGDEESMIALGNCYIKGEGVQKDALLGLHWMSKGGGLSIDQDTKMAVLTGVAAIAAGYLLAEGLDADAITSLEQANSPHAMREMLREMEIKHFSKEYDLNRARIEAENAFKGY